MKQFKILSKKSDTKGILLQINKISNIHRSFLSSVPKAPLLIPYNDIKTGQVRIKHVSI